MTAPILIVDDNEAKRLALVAVVSPLGYPIVAAALTASAETGPALTPPWLTCLDCAGPARALSNTSCAAMKWRFSST